MRKIFVLLILVSTGISLKAQDVKLTLKKVPQPIVVDGDVKDWGEKPFVLYNVDTKLKYGFAYDDKYLYLCYQSEDRMNQMKIMQAGMSISLNIKAAKKATVGIEYPLKKNISADSLRMLMGFGNNMRTRDTLKQGKQQELRGDSVRHLSPVNATLQGTQMQSQAQLQKYDTNMHKQFQDTSSRVRRDRGRMEAKRIGEAFLSMQTTMNLSGFINKNGTQQINNANEVNVKMNWDSAGAMVYEIAIPFTEIFADPKFSASSIKQIVLETTINVPEIPEGFRQFRFGDGGAMPPMGGDNSPRGGGMNRGNFDPTTFFAPATSKHTIYMDK